MKPLISGWRHEWTTQPPLCPLDRREWEGSLRPSAPECLVAARMRMGGPQGQVTGENGMASPRPSAPAECLVGGCRENACGWVGQVIGEGAHRV